MRTATEAWNSDVETLLRQANPGLDAATAERLTALVESLSERWHSGSLTRRDRP